MAEPEKGDSLTGKGKGKTSEQDEDISKDFFTSWKSNDDMDFNFEPVTKSSKKAFDFDKLDMDFGDFGKLSAFKLDMPDIDFSSSPKKSTKPKEKSDDKSVKGNGPAKKNEFTFSFDFAGFDEFSLGSPPARGTNPSRKKSIEKVDSMDGIESDDLSRQVVQDSGAPEVTISKRSSPVSEDAPNTKSKDLLDDEGIIDTSTRNSPSNSENIVQVVQPKETRASSEEILAADIQEMYHQSLLSNRTADKSNAHGEVHDFDSSPESISTSIIAPQESANPRVPSETKITMSSPGYDKGTQLIENTSKLNYDEPKENYPPALPSVVQTSTGATLADEMNDSSAVVLASDTDKEKPEKLPQVSTDKESTSNENCELDDVSSSGDRLALDVVGRSTPSVPVTMTSDAQYDAEAPRSVSKYFAIPSGSGSTVRETTPAAFKVTGGGSSKLAVPRETSGDVRTKLSTLVRTRDDLSRLGVDRRVSSGKKFDDNLRSSTNKLVTEDPVSEKTEENADADNVSRERIGNTNGKVKVGVATDTVSQDGQAMKDACLLGNEKKTNDPTSSGGLTAVKTTGAATKFPGGNSSKLSMPRETSGEGRAKLSMLVRKREDLTQPGVGNRRDSIEKMNGGEREGVDTGTVLQDGQVMKDSLLVGSEKKTNDTKSSSFHVPSSESTGRETKMNNQYPEKFEDKIPSIVPVQKSNIAEPNKLSSLKFGKKLSGLSSLKTPVNVNVIAKHSARSTPLDDAKSAVNIDLSARFQAMTNLTPSIGAEKLRFSTPSLKRKPFEAATDVGSIERHPSKRPSPSDKRMAKEVPASKVEDEVCIQAMQLEGSRKNGRTEHPSPKFDSPLEMNVEELGVSLMVESDSNVEQAEACAKELEDMCSMLKKKHEEAKELLVRALVNHNNLLMLNHPMHEEKIRAVQSFADSLMSK